VPAVTLVGYTNAGKSTLFNALTGTDAYVADQLFATLDPTVRRLRLPGGAGVVLADTVGFIRELPHELVAAFQSTLQEARDANLLVHVIDASDPNRDQRIGEVNAVLEEIGADGIAQLRVYNKIDRLQLEPRVERDPDGRIAQVWVSAAQGRGMDLLREAVAERLELAARNCWLQLLPRSGALRSRLYAAGVVREERSLEDGQMQLRVEMPTVELDRLLQRGEASLMIPQLPCAPDTAYLESPSPRAARS